MTPIEFKQAFQRLGENGCHIAVRTKSGKRYWVHEDQTEYLGDDEDRYVYGSPVKPHARDRLSVRWFHISNIELVNPERPDQAS